MHGGLKRISASNFQMLKKAELQKIHSTSLYVLEEIGTVIQQEEALHLLQEAGAFVEEGNRAYIPRGLVEGAIRTAPSCFTLYNRNGKPALLLNTDNIYFGTGSDCPFILDSFTGEKRKFLYRDVKDGIKICDYLPHIDFVMSNGYVSDVNQVFAYQYQYAAMVRNTTKPCVITAGDLNCLKDIVDIASTVVGGIDQLSRRPILMLYLCPISPLVHPTEALENLLYMAEKGLPVNYSPDAMAGGTAPVTVAGAVAQVNAEILTGLVIHQLKNPGAPFVFGGGISPMDMFSIQPDYCSPEAMMGQAAICQMARFYGLPSFGYGGCSVSKMLDEQAVAEASDYIWMSALMGTNLIHDLGYLEYGFTFSFDLLMICDEIIGKVKRFMKGFQVDQEHLAIDTIKKVGPGGHYLSEEHTFNHFRGNWVPNLSDRNTYDTWMLRGGTSMGQRTKAKIQLILDNHQPQPILSEVDRKITEIVEKT